MDIGGFDMANDHPPLIDLSPARMKGIVTYLTMGGGHQQADCSSGAGDGFMA